MTRRAMIRLIVLLVAALVIGYLGARQGAEEGAESGPDPPAIANSLGEEEILEAFRTKSSGWWVQSSGVVDRNLADDNQGARHQRFILRLSSGHSLLVSHNIDLAPRLQDLSPGNRVAFRGEYEWNVQGGIVHWTHHDPRGRKPGGWLEWKGERYR